MVKRKSNKLKELREFTKRAPELDWKRYKKIIEGKQTEDPAVRKRLYQMLKATEAKKVRETAVQLATPAYKRGLSPGARRLDTKVGAVVRKAIHLAAPRGFVKEITRPKGKGTGRGRGRPKKSYKLRFVPGIGAVRVPTHIYNKMMAEVRAKRRLAQAQKQALIQQQQAAQYEAEQIAQSQDPRFQPQDAFLESPDMEHEQEVMQVKQRMLQQQAVQQYQQQMEQEQKPSVAARAGQMFGRARLSLMGSERERQMQMSGRQVPQIHRSQVQEIHRPQVNMDQHQPRSPQVTLLGKSALLSRGPNILGQRNEFNETNRATIGFGR